MFNKISFICLVLAISKSNCIELENICDTFKHNGSNGDSLTVNSVYKMKFNLPIRAFRVYLIDENINYENIFSNNPQVAQRMNYIRTTNNKLVKEVFTEKFLNSPENFRTIHIYITTVMNNLKEANSLKIQADSDKLDELDNNTIQKLQKIHHFVFMIYFLEQNFFKHDDDSLRIFEHLISNLKKSIESDQKFVLENETSDYIHKNMKIFSFTKFMTHESSRISLGTLTLHVYLPFYNPKYVKSDNCLSVKNLPEFYDVNYK